ncbi:hypothetical protein J437_LFUL007234, partial [Ladona fulva]
MCVFLYISNYPKFQDDETVINAQETISAAIRLATNLNDRGKLSDVFLRHLRNAVIRMTEPEPEYFEDSLEDNVPFSGLPGAAQSPERSFGEAWGWQNPTDVNRSEGISLSDSTKNFWEKGLRRLARSPPPPPRATRSKTPRYRAPQTYAEHYGTGAIPRRLFPDTNGRFPCECEPPTTPCLVTGPITWTPSPAGAASYSPTYSSDGSYRGSSLPTMRLTKSGMRSPDSSAGVGSSVGDNLSGRRTRRNTSGSIPWLPSPDSSLARGEPNVTSLSRASGDSGRRGISTRSQFLPEINSTNVSGSWGTPSRVLSPRSPVNPVEGSDVSEQSSGSIPSWRIRADRDALTGNYGTQSRAKAPRSRSLSPLGRRRRPVAQCSACAQSVDSSAATMNTFGGFPNAPEYLPLRYGKNWS